MLLLLLIHTVFVTYYTRMYYLKQKIIVQLNSICKQNNLVTKQIKMALDYSTLIKLRGAEAWSYQ